jgi:hypothetical protein
VLHELKRRTWTRTVTVLLEEIAENVLCGKLKEVIKMIDTFVNAADSDLHGI